VKNSDSDETVESETGSVSVTTSSDLASPTKVIDCCISFSSADKFILLEV